MSKSPSHASSAGQASSATSEPQPRFSGDGPTNHENFYHSAPRDSLARGISNRGSVRSSPERKYHQMFGQSLKNLLSAPEPRPVEIDGCKPGAPLWIAINVKGPSPTIADIDGVAARSDDSGTSRSLSASDFFSDDSLPKPVLESNPDSPGKPPNAGTGWPYLTWFSCSKLRVDHNGLSVRRPNAEPGQKLYPDRNAKSPSIDFYPEGMFLAATQVADVLVEEKVTSCDRKTDAEIIETQESFGQLSVDTNRGSSGFFSIDGSPDNSVRRPVHKAVGFEALPLPPGLVMYVVRILVNQHTTMWPDLEIRIAYQDRPKSDLLCSTLLGYKKHTPCRTLSGAAQRTALSKDFLTRSNSNQLNANDDALKGTLLEALLGARSQPVEPVHVPRGVYAFLPGSTSTFVECSITVDKVGINIDPCVPKPEERHLIEDPAEQLIDENGHKIDTLPNELDHVRREVASDTNVPPDPAAVCVSPASSAASVDETDGTTPPPPLIPNDPSSDTRLQPYLREAIFLPITSVLQARELDALSLQTLTTKFCSDPRDPNFDKSNATKEDENSGSPTNQGASAKRNGHRRSALDVPFFRRELNKKSSDDISGRHLKTRSGAPADCLPNSMEIIIRGELKSDKPSLQISKANSPIRVQPWHINICFKSNLAVNLVLETIFMAKKNSVALTLFPPRQEVESSVTQRRAKAAVLPRLAMTDSGDAVWLVPQQKKKPGDSAGPEQNGGDASSKATAAKEEVHSQGRSHALADTTRGVPTDAMKRHSNPRPPVTPPGAEQRPSVEGPRAPFTPGCGSGQHSQHLEEFSKRRWSAGEPKPRAKGDLAPSPSFELEANRQATVLGMGRPHHVDFIKSVQQQPGEDSPQRLPSPQTSFPSTQGASTPSSTSSAEKQSDTSVDAGEKATDKIHGEI